MARRRWPAAVPQPGPPIADQDPAQVAANWPATSGVRLAPAMLQAQQKWVIAPVANARRISGRAVLQNHDRGHGALADGDSRWRAHRRGVHAARLNSCGASISSPMAPIA